MKKIQLAHFQSSLLPQTLTGLDYYKRITVRINVLNPIYYYVIHQTVCDLALNAHGLCFEWNHDRKRVLLITEQHIYNTTEMSNLLCSTPKQD